MVAAALHDRAIAHRKFESPSMIASLLLACEMTQHTQSHKVLKKAIEIHNLKHSKSGVPDAAPHNDLHHKRIARRLGIDFNIAKWMKKVFEAILSDLQEALEKGGEFVAAALDEVKKFLQGLGIRTDFIDNFAPPKIGFQIEKEFGWGTEIGSKKHIVSAMGFDMDAMGKAQASIFDFSMTFEFKGKAYLKVAAVNEAFKIDVIKADAHFRATQQKIFGVPTDLGSVVGILTAINQFVTGTINKILLFLQQFKEKLSVYVNPAKEVLRNVRFALDTVTEVRETLGSTKQVLDEVVGMLDQGGAGTVIMNQLMKYLEKTLEPLKKEITEYFARIKPTINDFSSYVENSLNRLETKVASPIRKGVSAAQNLKQMYDKALEKVAAKVEDEIGQVTTLLSTKLLAMEDIYRIKKYLNSFKDVKEAVTTAKKWADEAKRLGKLAKVLKFEQADVYIMKTLTQVKQAIENGLAYDALSALDPPLLSKASNALRTVTEQLENPTRAVRTFVKLAQNGTNSDKARIKNGMAIANTTIAKLGADLKQQLSGFLSTFTNTQLETFSVDGLAVNVKNALTMENFAKGFLDTINLGKLKPAKLASITLGKFAQDALRTFKLSQLAAGTLPKLDDFVPSNLQDIGLGALVDLKRKALKVIDLSPQLLSTWGLNKLVGVKFKLQDFVSEKMISMHLSDLATTILADFTVKQLEAKTSEELDLSSFVSDIIKSLTLADVLPAKRPGGKSVSASVVTLSNTQLKQIKVRDLSTNGKAFINNLRLEHIVVQARDAVRVTGVVFTKIMDMDLHSVVPVMLERLRVKDLKPLVLGKLTLQNTKGDLLDTISLGSLRPNNLVSLNIADLKHSILKTVSLDKLKSQVLDKLKLASLQDDVVKTTKLDSLDPSFLKTLLPDSLTVPLDLKATKLVHLSKTFLNKMQPGDASKELLGKLNSLAKQKDKFVNLLGKGKEFKGKLDSAIGRVNEFCKKHEQGGLVGVAEGELAQGIEKFKSVLTTVDMLKRGNETLCQALDTSKKVIDKIAPPLIRMCKNVNAVKAAGLEATVNAHLRKVEILLRGALVHGKQLSVDFARQKVKQKVDEVVGKARRKLAVGADNVIPIAHRAAAYTKEYINPLMSELQKLPVQNMVDVAQQLNKFLQEMRSLSDNIKSYGEPGGSSFDTFQRKFPRIFNNLDSLVKKSGHDKFADKLKDVLANFRLMESNANSWLAQIQHIVGDSTEACTFTGSCLVTNFQYFESGYFRLLIVYYVTDYG